jgi:Ca2+-binding EF-hand superfamily protein
MSEARIREAFAAFDADRSGTISASEMKKILSRGDSQLLSADEVDELIREFDTNGDGQLSLSEFAAACASMDDDEAEALSAKLDEHVVKVAFDVFDLDSDGVLNRSDLSAILKRQEWDAPSFEPLISSGEMDELLSSFGDGEALTLDGFTRACEELNDAEVAELKVRAEGGPSPRPAPRHPPLRTSAATPQSQTACPPFRSDPPPPSTDPTHISVLPPSPNSPGWRMLSRGEQSSRR